ncbi:MAG: hypothetical protein ACP5DZ_07725 [Bacteroidales bacterium]
MYYKDIFDFYSIEGAIALNKKFRTWEGGKLIVPIPELPYKCPVAPLEFVFLAEPYFTEKGIRNKVDITYVTLMSGAFTWPIASKMLGELLEEKNIKVVTDFYTERIDNEKKQLVSYDERTVDFDILTIVPVNKGSKIIENSKMGDDMGFVPTDNHTLKSEK